MTAPGPTKAEEVQERLAELLANGWSVPSLAIALGVFPTTVYDWVKGELEDKRAQLVSMALGHRMFGRPPSPTKPYRVPGVQERLENLVGRGWTLQVIAEILGTSRTSVSKWRHVGAGNRDRITAVALDNPYFNRKPPKQRRYGPRR